MFSSNRSAVLLFSAAGSGAKHDQNLLAGIFHSATTSKGTRGLEESLAGATTIKT